MPSAAVTLSHVGAGCNRVVDALSWGETGLLAYAAHNAVLIYNTEEARVLGTLLGHTDRVNCVHWLPSAALGLPGASSTAATALASGSGDSSVRIWQWNPSTPGQPWRQAAVLQGHSGPVTSLTSLPLPGSRGQGLLLVSTAGDGEVLVWECCPSPADSTQLANGSSAGNGSSSLTDATPPLLQQGAWRLRQRLLLGHQLQACASLAPLPSDPDWVLLALGGVDAIVRLYLCPPAGQFEAVCQLAGHQDWIKGLAFAQLDDGKLLLASASQDKNVRVWAVQQQGQQQQQQANGQTGSAELPAAGTAALLTRYAPKPLISTAQHEYSATLEALLIGHEDWVHSVAWHPSVPRGDSGGSSTTGTSLTQPPCLLTASMDRTMMVWRPDAATGLWMCEESVGDAGANHLGYYTGVWGPDGRGIAAHGFTGALHIWRRQGGEGSRHSGDGGWLPAHALGGHFGQVVDACWAADGACLLTVSTDQTARITTQLAGGHWCEIARPQVHGHDFSSVAALPLASSGGSSGGSGSGTGSGSSTGSSGSERQRYLYASGSEEKVIRVFEAPRAFRDTLAMARGHAVTPASSARQQTQQGGSTAGAALGALLPALGLSNKAVFDEREDDVASTTAGTAGGLLATGAEAYTEGADLVPHSCPSAVAGPPLEEHLAQNTLWPEIHKLYGHGNELYCLAADPCGRFLASACRAQSIDAAAIWVWDTRNWTGVAQLTAHTLTVTQLAFSPDGRYLASASRDRTVAIFERQQDGQQQQQSGQGGGGTPPFRLVGRIKAHARIVWGLHWAPDSRLLATASRDGKVKVWDLAGASAPQPALPAAPVATLACGDSVRSVQFTPDCQPGSSYHLAAGLDNGSVQLLHLAASRTPPLGEEQLQAQQQQQQQQQQQFGLKLLWQAPHHEQHAAAVRRLCWRREGGDAGGHGAVAGASQSLQLASVSEDHSLRIFAVDITL